MSENRINTVDTKEKNALLLTCLGVVFLITFQAYLVASILPELTIDLRASSSLTGLTIPSFALPYGLSALFYGYLGGRFRRTTIIVTLICMMVISLFFIAACHSVWSFLLIRTFGGLSAGPLVPLIINMMADDYNWQKRIKPAKLIFIAAAAGMTFGPVVGAYGNPSLGWREIFKLAGIVGVILLLMFFSLLKLKPELFMKRPITLKKMFAATAQILSHRENRQVYSFIFLNGILHSGIFVWTTYVLTLHYQLDDRGLGIALFGFGVPGLFLVGYIGMAADKFGLNKTIIAGLALIGLTIALLIFKTPLWLTGLAITVLSIAFVITVPLFAGMFNELRKGFLRDESFALGFCLLFLGYGSGPLIFIYVLKLNVSYGLSFLAVMGILIAALSVRIFNKKLKSPKPGQGNYAQSLNKDSNSS